MRDLYNILGIEKSATEKEIKKAYKNKAKEYHPDKNKDGNDQFLEIQKAYDILIDKEKRQYYDETGRSKSNIPDIKKVAEDFLQQIFRSNILSKIQQLDIEKNDMLAFLKRIVNTHILDCKRKIDILEKQIKSLKKLDKKIQHKEDTTNILNTILKRDIEITTNDINQLFNLIELNRMVIEILDEYNYV